MSPLLVEFLGVVFRWLITSLGAYLIAHHVLTGDQEARFADGAIAYVMSHAIIWAPLVSGLLLGLWAKYKARLKFLGALELPKGSTEAEAKAKGEETGIKAEAFAKTSAILLACVLGAGAMMQPACASVQTHVSPVADVANAAGKVEESAHIIFQEAVKANGIVNPSTGRPLVSRQAVDVVSIAVNKIGHLGRDLDAALGDYNAAKAAGKDLQAQRVVVQKVLADLSTAMADVGRAIPNGTLTTIDQAAAAILGILTQVKGVVGL